MMGELYSRSKNNIEGIRETERDGSAQKRKIDMRMSIEKNIDAGNVSREEANRALDELISKLEEFQRMNSSK